MEAFFKQLEKWLGGGPNGAKRVKTLRWLLLIGLFGVLIMIIQSMMDVQPLEPMDPEQASMEKEQVSQQKDPTGASAFRQIEAEIEGRLKEILEKIVGVGAVEILVSVESTEEIIVYQNETSSEQITNETDRNGAKRHITNVTKSGEIMLYEASGGERPIIVKTIKPEIRGVVVVARGAENKTVNQLLTEAVTRGLDLAPYRVSVIPRKQN